jgi:hypothetical protein
LNNISVRVYIVTLVIRHASRIISALYYIVICGLSGFTKFSTLPN